MSLSSCSLGDCRLWTADLQSVKKTLWDKSGVSEKSGSFMQSSRFGPVVA